MANKIKYWLRAVIAAIRGREIDFALMQIEAWIKAELTNQKITDAVYSSDLNIELNKTSLVKARK